MKVKGNTEEILHGNLIKAILSIAIPVVINSFLQTMYNLTDTFWLGKLGTEELAAINLVTPVQQIVMNFGSGITVAGAVLISQLIGARNIKKANNLANEIFICAIGFSVVMAVLLSVFASGIVAWLGADGLTAQYATTYLTLVILDMPFLYTVNIFQSVNQAQGDTVRPMFLNLLGICINMVLDPLLMVVLHWGVAGAALATVFAKMIPAIVAFIKLHTSDKEVRLSLKTVKFLKEDIKKIITVGFPTAIGGSTMQFGFLLMSKNVYVFGTQAMAAYGIGNKVNGLITLPSNGIGSAVSTIVGQNYGANQLDRAYKGYKISMYIAVGFLFVGGMILSRPFLSTAMVTVFSDDPEVIRMAADFLSIMAFWCFANGVHNCTSGLFQGSGHTEVTMIIDVTRLWVFRFATLFFCQKVLNMGVESVWYSVVVSNGLAAACLFVTMMTGYWKKKRV